MTAVDSITVEVIRNYLLSAAREMNRNLLRTAYSTIVYEVHDFGLGIYDRECRLLAEAPGLAIFTRANDYALKKVVDFLGIDQLYAGDIVLLNYPYWNSTHTLDVVAVSPIFFQAQLAGFTAVKVHWLDLGQKDAGYCLDTTSVYQEGLILPCVKIYDHGVLNNELLNLIRFNSRMPDRVIGDMNAQISACRTGERRVSELIQKFGLETYQQAAGQILEHGERLARSRLAALPKGTWAAEDWIDDDGIDKEKLVKIKATVTITPDEFIVDFTGSADVVKGPINMPIGNTLGVAAMVFKAITTPDSPANEGNFRPLRVIAPPNTLMHAVHPAPTFTLWTSQLSTEVVTKALAQGMPELIPACSGGDICSVMGVGVHPSTGQVWLEATNEGVGFGGHAGDDGENGIMHMTEPGCRNNPVEVLETKAPWLIERYELRRDSAGPGRHRGGLGVTRVYRFLAEASALTLVKKTRTKPWGIAGGGEGENCHVIVWPGTDQEHNTGMDRSEMRPGDVLVNASGGGGGWGSPFERDIDKVVDDVRDDYVSIEAADRRYGVVIDSTTLTIDQEATAARRAALPER
jgi:N-methylhydantoinase B